MSPDFYCPICDVCDHVPHDDKATCLKQHQEWLVAAEARAERYRQALEQIREVEPWDGPTSMPQTIADLALNATDEETST